MSATDLETPSVPSGIEELLNNTRTQMESELEELRPQHEAFLRLEQILSNFDQVTSDKPRKGGQGNGSRAPRGSRSAEFLALVRASGEEGITVGEAADQMEGINPNYLYRIAKDLTDAGDIVKVDKKYVATPETPETPEEPQAGSDAADGDKDKAKS